MNEDAIVDLEIKLAYQEKLIRDLDALVRTFGERLDKALRELEQLKQSINSPVTALGPHSEKPPHY